MGQRLFIGIPATEGLCLAVSQWQSNHSPRLPFGKPIPKENLHCTLHFLGQVENSSTESLRRSISKFYFHPFTFTFNNLQGFPSNDKATVLAFTGMSGVSPFSQLFHQTAALLAEIGRRSEARLFIPHISVWRSNKPLQVDVSLRKLDPVFLEVSQIHLYESSTTPEGSRYRILASSPDNR